MKMAVANRELGAFQSVTRGYKGKKRTARAEATPAQHVFKSLREGACELRGLFGDEIAYATMDTLRLLRYLQYELGFTRMERKSAVKRGKNADWKVEIGERRLERSR